MKKQRLIMISISQWEDAEGQMNADVCVCMAQMRRWHSTSGMRLDKKKVFKIS